MTGWAQGLDDLAAATAALLKAGPVRTEPLVDPPATMACRDAVVGQLRELVGSVSQAPRFAPVAELTVFDIVQRPGQALHQALSGLPRSVPFGTAEQAARVDKNLPAYEQHWRRAAHATVGLEGYLAVAGQLPDHAAWAALRDLADIAAALPALDHGLSEALLPDLKIGEDLSVPYRMLTHPGHDAVRLAAGEIRTRVAAYEHSATDPRRVAVLGPNPAGTGELSTAMARYVTAVSATGGRLSMPDMRAVTRLLEFGSADAAQVLERTGPAVSGAGEVASGLRQVSPLATQLRTTPTCSITTEHLELLREGRNLQARMRELAVAERRLPGGASDNDLRRLAAPALEFAQHVPALARALEVSVRESLTQGLMLVPNVHDGRNRSNLQWVTASMGSRRDGAPAVQHHAGQLAQAAGQIEPAVRAAQADLARHTTRPPDAADQAAAAARRHVGVARAELRAVLSRRLTEQPVPLSAQLPSHPRLAARPRDEPAGPGPGARPLLRCRVLPDRAHTWVARKAPQFGWYCPVGRGARRVRTRAVSRGARRRAMSRRSYAPPRVPSTVCRT